MDIYRLESTKFNPSYGILCACIAKRGDRDGLYPTFCKIAAGGSTVRHSHFEAEFFFIVSGTGRFEIENEKRDVGGGDLIRISPFSHHALKNTGSEDLVFLSIYSEDFEVPPLPLAVVVTAAPPTPNGPLHLGHISGPYLASDIVSRYLRLRATSVQSHTGTDDHQNYVSEKALSLNLNSETFRRGMRTRIEKGFQAMGVRFDEFIEPKTDLKYQTRVLQFAQAAINAGIVEKETIAFPYCRQCDHALVDSLIDGTCPFCGEPSRGGCENCGIVVPPQDLLNPKCARCDRSADQRPVNAYFFNLANHLGAIQTDLNKLALSPRLRNLIDQVGKLGNSKVLVSHPDVNGEGLKLPGTNQTLHVWFEMAAHYERFATGAESWIHCFGFDNSFYYLLFIPALLKALNPRAKLPSAVITNEFLLLEGLKFSTSRGHAIWADEFDGNTDHLRLYLCLQRPLTLQSDFSFEAFRRFSIDVESQLRQLHDRARALAPHNNEEVSPRTLVDCNRFTREMERLLSPGVFDLRRAGRQLMAFMDLAIQRMGEGGSEKLMLRTLATVMAPIMPTVSESLLNALGEVNRGWIVDWSRSL